jgi:hypothetical protein
MDKPTICAECAHRIPRWSFDVEDDCAARPNIDIVSGGPIYAPCRSRNSGNCPDFAPKPRPWWRRLFSGRASEK